MTNKIVLTMFKNAKPSIYLMLFTIVALLLSGCGMGGSRVSESSNATPYGLTLEDSSEETQHEQYSGVRLDVVVPVFDPGIPEDPDEYEKLGIWPEIRRTEAIRFAVALKKELQKTNSFGDIRVSPDKMVAADLFVLGKIEKSNGEDIKISVSVYDISGQRWMQKNYKHRVKEYHWQDLRQKGEDPYQPAFEKVAKDIKKLLKKRSPERLAELRVLSEILFANVFVEEAFAEHIKIKNKKVSLESLPAENDPMLARTRAVRVVDGLFMDSMQGHYHSFVEQTNDSYVAWQEHSLTESKQMRKAKTKSAAQGIFAGLLLLGAAAAAADSDTYYDPAASNAMLAATVSGVMLMQESFASSAEGKYHRDNLMELGQSLNFEVAPQVIEHEQTTVTLRGDVQEQFLQWRSYLKKLYAQEMTPSTTI